MRAWFDRFATHAAAAAGTPWAFGAAALIICVWASFGPSMGWSDTHQLVINCPSDARCGVSFDGDLERCARGVQVLEGGLYAADSAWLYRHPASFYPGSRDHSRSGAGDHKRQWAASSYRSHKRRRWEQQA